MKTASASALRSVRVLLAGGFALAGLMLGGCATLDRMSDERDMDLFFRTAPLPSLVQQGEELKTAERAAERIPGAMAFRGDGRSMEPIYAPGTAIVVSEKPYAELRKGTPVVYMNSRGYYVAHLLLEHTPRGWRAIGANNAEADAELVTARNLIGVITEAYASTETPDRQEWMARLAMAESARGTKVGMVH